MNDFLHELGWIAKKYELLVIFWFLVTQLPKHGWSFFFARHSSLNTLELHELHSCFMVALVFFLFHVFSSEVERYLLSLSFERDALIKVFYTGIMAQKFLFLVALYVAHRLRGCLFSKTARVCMYMALMYMSLLFMELVARGYFDYHKLGMIYRAGCWLTTLVTISALSIYPIRQTLKYFTERREQAAN